MKKSSKLVFFGTEDFSLPSLAALVEAGHDVVAVVTKPDSARGRSGTLVAPVVKTYALNNKITVHQPDKLSELLPVFEKMDADAGVLVSYGKILPRSVLDVFEPVGIVNLHPFLLPKYRGPAPIEPAIVNGDSETGISIMKLTAGMDEGPVYRQETVRMIGTEIKPAFADALARQGAKLLVEALPGILSGELRPNEQQGDASSYTSLLSRADGMLDTSVDTADVMERKIRAYLGYPKTRLKLGEHDVVVTKASVVGRELTEPIVVRCANDTYLSVDELIAPSGKTMAAEAYLRGYAA